MGRGKSDASLALIEACREILAEIQPTTVRSVCYQLFTRSLIPSMAKTETNRVGIQITYAREQGIIPWDWIVDETREPEYANTWQDPAQFIKMMQRSYRRDRWEGQEQHIEVWSEKGTVRGTLGPVIAEYGLTFRVMHGYASATAVKQAATESTDSSHPWLAFYIGDWDPSGLHMSEVDLPDRLDEYGGAVTVQRIALMADDIEEDDLPGFPAKRSDTRYSWYVRHYGSRCWEVDALNPNILRSRVEAVVLAHIEPESWARYGLGEQAEQRSLKQVLGKWESICRQASK
jgi:hypothetical protein